MNMRHIISSRLLTFVFARLILILIVAVSTAQAAGEVDTSFNGSLLKVGTGQVFKSVIQPDGKIIITGDFNVAVTEGRLNIARLNPDGSLDRTFNPPAIVPLNSTDVPAIRGIALQADGKIVIGGYFTRGVRRLNPDGSDDTAFNNSPWFVDQIRVEALDIYPDGRIIYSGDRMPSFRNNLTILNPDGSVNADSNFRVMKFALQPDGKIIAYENNNTHILRRINQDLTNDDTFTQVSFWGPCCDPFLWIQSIVFQADGKIVVGGPFSSVNGGSLSGVARLNTNGTVDTSFMQSGTPVSGWSLAYLPDGKILVGGGSLVRLNTDGTRDNSFVAPSGFSVANDIDILTDGNVIVSCKTNNAVNIPSAVIRVGLTGTLDTSFAGPVGNAGVSSRIVVLPDNKIVAAGDFNFANGVPRRSLARFNADGTLDTTLVNQTTTPKPIGHLEVFPDGKMVIGTDSNIYRLNSDGTHDATFQDGTFAWDIKALSDGKMLVSRTNNGGVQRLKSNGTLDSGFATVSGAVYKIELQNDGKILIGGNFSQVNGVNRTNIARLNSNGSLDTSFNLPGGTSGQVNDIAVQSDGKIVVAGTFTSIGFTVRTGLARLNADGSLDTAFAPVINYAVNAVKILPDGKLLIGGEFSSVGSLARAGYARLFADGSLDAGFTVGSGTNGFVYDLGMQSDGKIIVAGSFSLVNGFGAPGVARVFNGPSISKTICDYDGDGRSDISVFRPSDGAWYLQRSHAGFLGMLWGLPTDRITPADYDGDGKTDVAVYRSSTGVWYVFNSSNGSVSYYIFGIAEDLPTPADYDGDGKADVSVFRPSTGTWYRLNSSDGSFFGIQFGVSGDRPAVGDFDGDGKSDISVFRPSNGFWYRINSSNGTFFYEQFGVGSDLIIPADYDGDNKTDLAVFTPSNGFWNVQKSASLTYIAYPFGLSTDIPTPADYDGDGKADLSVFRPSDGNWYRYNSANLTFVAYHFGTNGDKPTQAAFRY